jgi:hypothetical protein
MRRREWLLLLGAGSIGLSLLSSQSGPEPSQRRRLELSPSLPDGYNGRASLSPNDVWSQTDQFLSEHSHRLSIDTRLRPCSQPHGVSIASIAPCFSVDKRGLTGHQFPLRNNLRVEIFV